MDAKKLQELLEAYREGRLEGEDFLLLRSFLETEEGAEELHNVWDKNFEVRDCDISQERRQAIYDRLLLDKRLKQTESDRTTKSIVLRSIKWSAVAAVFIMVGALCLWWYQGKLLKTTGAALVGQALEIHPGSQKARIEFEDGTFLELEHIHKDTLIADKGIRIFKKEDGSVSYAFEDTGRPLKERFNTIITPKGGIYNLTLPDGSKVSLNAVTKLRYPLEFAVAERTVELEGEAYFEVNKQKSEKGFKPFFVISGNQKIEVRGTEFNVNTYTDKYKTTLLEGSVVLHYPHTSQVKELRPSQQAVYAADRQLMTIHNVDPSYDVAWRNGKFAFDNASIYDVMEEIARWYDIEVQYEGDLSQVYYSGTISRFENFEQLLQLIEWTDLVTFKVQGRRVKVMK